MKGLTVRFFLVDVFTDEPLAGNPLAVVPDADLIDVETMKRMAREFNQSETTFVLRPTQPDASWRLRCFMPSGIEAFGAGHNALGAWWWLADGGVLPLREPRAEFTQELGDRVLPVSVEVRDGRPVMIGMTQTAPVFGRVHGDVGSLATALGVNESDFTLDVLAAQVVSTGAAHLLIAMRSREAVSRARPDPRRLADIVRTVGAQGCYLFCLDPIESSSSAHARFFHPLMGVSEDPATGSAAGPLAAYLAARGAVAGDRSIVIEQGHAVGRPSRIEVRVQGSDVSVWGRGVVVGEGQLTI